MRIQTKLLVLALIPISFFMATAGMNIVDTNQTRRVVKVMMTNEGLLHASSELINELQKERGLSVLFLSGGADRTVLRKQRTRTNELIPEFEKRLQDSEIPQDNIRKGLSEIKTLQDLRNQVDRSDSIGKTKMAYTRLIRTCMNIQGAVSKAKTAKGIGKRFVSIVILEEAKKMRGCYERLCPAF